MPEGVQADLMAEELIAAGIPPDAIIREGASHNTHENAVWTVALLHAHRLIRIGVISDAIHLPRAVAAFRKLGIEARPIASDCYSCTFSGSMEQWFPRYEAAEANRYTMREWVGLLVYRVRGWV